MRLLRARIDYISNYIPSRMLLFVTSTSAIFYNINGISFFVFFEYCKY